jgi:propanol-preferring alcohol dehydrogenase
VANYTRADAREFLAIAAAIGVRTSVQAFALAEANAALRDHAAGRLVGTAVLVP